MSDDPQTTAVYDEQANRYREFISGAHTDPLLTAFMQSLPQGGTILDLGCGPGDYAGAMHAAGFNVVATDASAEMIKLARRHEGVDARQATFDDIPDAGLFDGVWANFSLLHATRADLPKIMQDVANVLNEPGVLYLAMKSGSGERRDSLGRHYAYYSMNELRELLDAVGLTVVRKSSGETRGLAGDVEPWFAFAAVNSQ